MTLPIKDLTNDELRALANIQLKSATELCLLLSVEDCRTYLDYITSGLAAFREGFDREG